VIILLEKLVSSGFFASKTDQMLLLPQLIMLLDGRTEKDPGETFSRHKVNEFTIYRMVLHTNYKFFINLIVFQRTKLRIARIIHTYFDLALEYRTADALSKFKAGYQVNN
jgi:hypothetical protein